ncbi:MAG: CcmD family protein [Caldithrix sp.]|nr:CcmD family protein [Caldithrix sp.]
MNPVYVVMIINLIIWAGIFGYMLNLSKHMSALRKKLNKLSDNEH